MRKMLEYKGITLIALVITIIVLLILAGVSIAMLTGENGLVTKASQAKDLSSHGAVREAISLAYNEYQLEAKTSNTTKIASLEGIKMAIRTPTASEMTFIEYLNYIKGYVDENGVIDTIALLGTRQALGNGTGTVDVYKIEETASEYELCYYDKSGVKETNPLWRGIITYKPTVYGLSADGKTFVGRNHSGETVVYSEGEFVYKSAGSENFGNIDFTIYPEGVYECPIKDDSGMFDYFSVDGEWITSGGTR